MKKLTLYLLLFTLLVAIPALAINYSDLTSEQRTRFLSLDREYNNTLKIMERKARTTISWLQEIGISQAQIDTIKDLSKTHVDTYAAARPMFEDVLEGEGEGTP
jgi:hypothetical protein